MASSIYRRRLCIINKLRQQYWVFPVIGFISAFRFTITSFAVVCVSKAITNSGLRNPSLELLFFFDLKEALRNQ
jgi:hypothetical protein